MDSDAVDLSWPTPRARLADFVRRYELAGAPSPGLPLDKEKGEAIHLRTLVQTGYLEETEFRTAHKTFIRPTERALVTTHGWPSTLSMAQEVVDEVITQLGQRPQQEAASLRTALTTGGRDLLVETVAAVLAKQSGLG